ncbi:hypothetical protein CsSME_00026467 [Camellia sinensis var. sinensis]
MVERERERGWLSWTITLGSHTKELQWVSVICLAR